MKPVPRAKRILFVGAARCSPLSLVNGWKPRTRAEQLGERGEKPASMPRPTDTTYHWSVLEDWRTEGGVCASFGTVCAAAVESLITKDGDSAALDEIQSCVHAYSVFDIPGLGEYKSTIQGGHVVAALNGLLKDPKGYYAGLIFDTFWAAGDMAWVPVRVSQVYSQWCKSGNSLFKAVSTPTGELSEKEKLELAAFVPILASALFTEKCTGTSRTGDLISWILRAGKEPRLISKGTKPTDKTFRVRFMADVAGLGRPELAMGLTEGEAETVSLAIDEALQIASSVEAGQGVSQMMVLYAAYFGAIEWEARGRCLLDAIRLNGDRAGVGEAAEKVVLATNEVKWAEVLQHERVTVEKRVFIGVRGTEGSMKVTSTSNTTTHVESTDANKKHAIAEDQVALESYVRG